MDKKNTLIGIGKEEFDKYMCSTYPDLFRDRNKPMSETCMCWGFDVGNGWYDLLDNLCKELKEIENLTGIEIIVDQVKEKLGGLRFYTTPFFTNAKITDPEKQKMWCDIIYGAIDRVENRSYTICASCGEFYSGQITVGHWIYDICEKCFRKEYPDRIDGLEISLKKERIKDAFENVLYNQKTDLDKLCAAIYPFEAEIEPTNLN